MESEKLSSISHDNNSVGLPTSPISPSCAPCRGSNIEQSRVDVSTGEGVSARALLGRLGILDRLLTPAILIAMIVGVIIGEFVPSVQPAFNTVQFKSVSVPIAIGLIVMMYPVLTKVRYEVLLKLIFNLFRRSPNTDQSSRPNGHKLLVHSILSFILNWLIAPFVMLALAWATLPDLPTYRTGLILVGLARCIAMVLIWNELAGGDREYCAILVVMNSLLQIVIYSPMAVFFINIIGHAEGDEKLRLEYGNVAISVLIVSIFGLRICEGK
ncbi:arsenical resistance-3 (ACR3) family protein [Abortiporus biennis]